MRRHGWMGIALVAVLAAGITVGCQQEVTTTLTPVADTYVEDATPAANYGTVTPITTDASPGRVMLVRFDLSGVPATVLSARLRLHVADVANGGSPNGGNIATVAGDWAESTVTWATRPTAFGPVVGEIGAVTANSWVEVTITEAVTPGASLTLAVRSPNSDGAYYDSREAGAALAPQLMVTTGPAPAAVTGTAVAAVGDMACAPGSAVTTTSCHHAQVSDGLVADTALASLLALGDLQYDNGELSGFQSAYDPTYGRLKAKTRPAPGNHEYNTAGATGYYAYFGAAAGDPAKGYYSFDLGTAWHVVMLNSNCSAVSCAAGSAQEQWLRADLAATTAPCVIAAWHHPRFTSSTGHSDAVEVAPFWAALDQAGADIVLSGHVHNYERFAPQRADGTPSSTGIRQFVVGTGGRSLYDFAGAHANSETRLVTFGHLRLVLGGGNRYSWQFRNETGTVLDHGTSACH